MALSQAVAARRTGSAAQIQASQAADKQECALFIVYEGALALAGMRHLSAARPLTARRRLIAGLDQSCFLALYTIQHRSIAMLLHWNEKWR